jgi:outer membrane murein-binding lipoprotein Lpp
MEEVGYMEKIQDLESKVNKLEYEEIKGIKEEIKTIQINLAENNILTRQSVESTDKLSDTLTTVKETMIQMSESMKTNNRVSEELASSVKSLNHQVNGLEDKMDCKFKEVDIKIREQEDKNKFDIMLWIKDNWISLVVGVGVIFYIALGKFGI